MLTLLFVLLFVLIFMGMDIAIVLMLSPILIIIATNLGVDFPIPLEVIPQYIYGGADVFSYTAIPLFILAGELMNQGGITNRLVDFSKKIIGHINGGIAQSSVLLNMIMSGMSGSAVADATATGSVMIPAMKNEGYKPEKGAAVIASAATIGPVIPPSIPLIIIGSMAGISVGQLFIAGIIPGILMGIGLMIYIRHHAIKNNIPRQERAPLKEQVSATRSALIPLGLPIIIIGSIMLGIASPTESAILGVVYALIVSGLVYKELSFKGLINSLKEATMATGTIMLTVVAGVLFGWVATYYNIGVIFRDILTSVGENKFIILIMINIMLLILGMVLETIPIILLVSPIIFPVIAPLGIDPVQMSIIITVNLMIGLITPPIGLNLFITSAISQTSIVKVTRATIPFLIVLLIVLMLITFIPSISLFLPNLLS